MDMLAINATSVLWNIMGIVTSLWALALGTALLFIVIRQKIKEDGPIFRSKKSPLKKMSLPSIPSVMPGEAVNDR